MVHVSKIIPLLLAAVLVLMLLFIVARRLWRALLFRRLDRWEEYWLQRLGDLLAGGSPDPKPLRKRRAREVLESLLLRRLETSAPAVRQQALELLERSGLLDSRFEVLRRGTRWQRTHSAAILGRIRSPVAVPALVEALNDPSESVRRTAVHSLGRIGSAAAAPGLIRFLQTSNSADKAIWLEAALQCVADAQEFLPLLESDRPEVRALAARAIAEFRQKLPIDRLEQFVFDPDPEVRAQMLRAIGNCGEQTALRLLVAATHDTEWFVRLRALAAIEKVKAVAALDSVMAATGDQNFAVRQQAAITLASLATRPEQVLRNLLAGDDRYAWESYLSQLARGGVLWRTLPLLCSKEDSLRQSAEELLGNAVRAGYFQEVEYAAAADPDRSVRSAAARLLHEYGSFPAPASDSSPLRPRNGAAPASSPGAVPAAKEVR